MPFKDGATEQEKLEYIAQKQEEAHEEGATLEETTILNKGVLQDYGEPASPTPPDMINMTDDELFPDGWTRLAGEKVGYSYAAEPETTPTTVGTGEPQNPASTGLEADAFDPDFAAVVLEQPEIPIEKGLEIRAEHEKTADQQIQDIFGSETPETPEAQETSDVPEYLKRVDTPEEQIEDIFGKEYDGLSFAEEGARQQERVTTNFTYAGEGRHVLRKGLQGASNVPDMGLHLISLLSLVPDTQETSPTLAALLTNADGATAKATLKAGIADPSQILGSFGVVGRLIIPTQVHGGATTFNVPVQPGSDG